MLPSGYLPNLLYTVLMKSLFVPVEHSEPTGRGASPRVDQLLPELHCEN